MKTSTFIASMAIALLTGSVMGCGGASNRPEQAQPGALPPKSESAVSQIKAVETQPLNPRSLEAAAALTSRGDAVFVAGNLVFRGASGGLVIGELVDGGKKMFERSAVYLPDAASDVLVHKGVAFVACGPQGVFVIDVSDPGKPKPLSTLKTLGAALRFSLDGERLLVANGSMGLLLLDVADPKIPVPVSMWRSEGYVRHAVLKNGVVFAAEDTSGVSMLRVDENGELEFAWRRDLEGQARGLRLVEDKLLVANGPSGFALLDLSNPSQPEEAGRLVLKDMARDVEQAERKDRVFVANGDDGIITIDISNPASMKETSAFVPDKPANRINVQGNRLYIGNDSDGMLVLDVSNPDKPVRVFPATEPK